LNIAFSSVLMARLILFHIDIQVFFVIPAKSWNPLGFDIQSIIRMHFDVSETTGTGKCRFKKL
jgi:hypothetical protein